MDQNRTKFRVLYTKQYTVLKIVHHRRLWQLIWAMFVVWICGLWKVYSFVWRLPLTSLEFTCDHFWPQNQMFPHLTSFSSFDDLLSLAFLLTVHCNRAPWFLLFLLSVICLPVLVGVWFTRESHGPAKPIAVEVWRVCHWHYYVLSRNCNLIELQSTMAISNWESILVFNAWLLLL